MATPGGVERGLSPGAGVLPEEEHWRFRSQPTSTGERHPDWGGEWENERPAREGPQGQQPGALERCWAEVSIWLSLSSVSLHFSTLYP